MSGSPHLEVGFVSRVHGLKGELEVRLFDPQSTAFDEVERLVFRSPAGDIVVHDLTAVRETAKGTLVFLEGIDRREDAEKLLKNAVMVFRQELSPPGENEVFQGDLIGILVRDENNRALGRIEEIWNDSPTPNLVIRGLLGEGEVIVPYVDEFVLSLDLKRGEMVVRPPLLTAG